MPKALEDALKRGAKKKGFKGKRADRYVYGALYNLGFPVGKGKKVRKKGVIKKSARYNT